MVTDTNFKFDVHFPRDIPDTTLYKISKKGTVPESGDPYTRRIYAL